MLSISYLEWMAIKTKRTANHESSQEPALAAINWFWLCRSSISKAITKLEIGSRVTAETRNNNKDPAYFLACHTCVVRLSLTKTKCMLTTWEVDGQWIKMIKNLIADLRLWWSFQRSLETPPSRRERLRWGKMCRDQLEWLVTTFLVASWPRTGNDELILFNN